MVKISIKSVAAMQASLGLAVLLIVLFQNFQVSNQLSIREEVTRYNLCRLCLRSLFTFKEVY